MPSLAMALRPRHSSHPRPLNKARPLELERRRERMLDRRSNLVKVQMPRSADNPSLEVPTTHTPSKLSPPDINSLSMAQIQASCNSRQ